MWERDLRTDLGCTKGHLMDRKNRKPLSWACVKCNTVETTDLLGICIQHEHCSCNKQLGSAWTLKEFLWFCKKKLKVTKSSLVWKNTLPYCKTNNHREERGWTSCRSDVVGMCLFILQAVLIPMFFLSIAEMLQRWKDSGVISILLPEKEHMENRH